MLQASPRNSLFHLKAASLLATLLTLSPWSLFSVPRFSKSLFHCVFSITPLSMHPLHTHVLTDTYGHTCVGHVHVRIYTHVD